MMEENRPMEQKTECSFHGKLGVWVAIKDCGPCERDTKAGDVLLVMYGNSVLVTSMSRNFWVAATSNTSVFSHIPYLPHPPPEDMPKWNSMYTEITKEFRCPKDGELYLTGPYGLERFDAEGAMVPGALDRPSYTAKQCRGGWSVNNGLRWILKKRLMAKFIVTVDGPAFHKAYANVDGKVSELRFHGRDITVQEIME